MDNFSFLFGLSVGKQQGIKQEKYKYEPLFRHHGKYQVFSKKTGKSRYYSSIEHFPQNVLEPFNGIKRESKISSLYGSLQRSRSVETRRNIIIRNPNW